MNFAIEAFTCQAVVENARRIPQYCYQLLEDKRLDDEFGKELYLFASFTKSELPEFTAAGFFTINRTILCSVLGTLISYYIVTLQINGRAQN